MSRAGLTFRPLGIGDARRLFDWRRKTHVAQWMTSAPPDDFEQHQDWMAGQLQSSDVKHWIIERLAVPAGLLTLEWRNRDTGVLTWGFYIGETEALGLGAMVPPMLYNAVFERSGIEVLEAEVLEGNADVIGLHRVHGYDKRPVVSETGSWNGQRLEHFFLSRANWLAKVRYHRLRSDFDGIDHFLVGSKPIA